MAIIKKDMAMHLTSKIFVSLAILICSIGALLVSYISGHPIQGFLFNSDTLFLPVFLENLFQGGGSISDWYLPQVPFFFPDYLIFLGAYFLGGNIYGQIAIYSVFQVTLTFISIYFFAKELDYKGALFISVLASVLLIWLSLTLNGVEPFPLLLTSVSHFGAFLVEILSLALAIKYFHCTTEKQKNKIILYLCCLSFLATLSDTLFLAQFLIPLSGSIFIINVLTRQRLINNIYLATLPLIFGIMGLLSYSVVDENKTRVPIVIGTEKIIAHLIDGKDSVFGNLTVLFIKSPFFTFYFAIFYVFCSFCLFSLFRQRYLLNLPKEVIYVIIFVLFSSGAMLSAVLLITNQTVAVRYFIPAFCWPIIIGVIVTAYFLKDKFFYFGSVISIAAVTNLWFNTLALLKNNGVAKNYYPNEISCIDASLAKEQLSNGIAEYWDAKYIQAFSKSKITLAQYTRNLEEYRFITSKKYFKQTYDFVIVKKTGELAQRISKQELIELNGTPKKTLNCGDRDLLIYGKDGLRVRKFGEAGHSYKWRGCELSTAIGKYTSNCEIESTDRNQSGHVSFGPYASLPSGRYSFEIEYASSKNKSEPAGYWDVVISLPHKEKLLAQGFLLGTDSKTEKISGTFTLGDAYDREKIEVRTFAQQGGTMKINYLIIKRLE